MLTETYFYRGMIENFRFKWVRGYSACGESGGVIYPWKLKAQCRKEAKSLGMKAIFEEELCKPE